MPVSLNNRPWSWGGQKPPLGSKLDRSHPLAQGLVFAPLLNEGAGQLIWDSASLTQATLGTSYLAYYPVWAHGKGGACLDLQLGSLAYPAIPAYNVQTFTLACWINPNANDATSNAHAILNTGHNGGIAYRINSGKMQLVKDYVALMGSSNTSIVGDSWNHVAVTYDLETVKFYLNGLPDGSVSSTVAFSVFSGLWIGIDNTTGAEGWTTFPNIIDCPLMYNKALSAAQIASLYADPYQMIAPPAPWRYWSLPSGAVGLYVPYKYSQMIDGSPFMGGN